VNFIFNLCTCQSSKNNIKEYQGREIPIARRRGQKKKLLPSSLIPFTDAPSAGIQRAKNKKSPLSHKIMAQGLHPFFLLNPLQHHLCHTAKIWLSIKAGLLTSGSSYTLYLPTGFNTRKWIFTEFVPDNSGGTAPDFHGIPF